jgi:hypothetical protein
MSPRPPHKPSKSLMRNLGEFFGHIAAGVKSTPTPGGGNPQESGNPAPTDGPTKVVREQVQEQEVHTPQGKMVLRRRIIDEVEPPRE